MCTPKSSNASQGSLYIENRTCSLLYVYLTVLFSISIYASPLVSSTGGHVQKRFKSPYAIDRSQLHTHTIPPPPNASGA